MTRSDDALQADRFLVDEIRRGSEAGWRSLIARYQGRLLAFARTRLRKTADAEDAVQDAFVGLLQSLPHYDGARSLETYLFAILRNKILDACRRAAVRGQTVSFDQDRDLADSQIFAPAGGETPSGVLRQKELTAAQQDALVDALRALLAGYRDQDKFNDLQIIELLFFAGKRNKEAAALLDMDEKAVAGVKFRAVNRLRESLESRPGSASLFVNVDALAMESTVATLWADRRLTCLKRSTLGAHLLGIAEPPWDDYVAFHLQIVECPYCRANLDDLRAEADETPTAQLEQRLFTSSIGFLSRPSTAD